MFNFKKISQIVLMAAFMCALVPANVSAQARTKEQQEYNRQLLNQLEGRPTSDAFKRAEAARFSQKVNSKSPTELFSSGSSSAAKSKAKTSTSKTSGYKIPTYANPESSKDSSYDVKVPSLSAALPDKTVTVTTKDGKTTTSVSKNEKSCLETCNLDANTCEGGECVPKQGAGTQTTQPESTVTGCSANYGLFSGLISTGKSIFSGLRDLIYVVAGFGIIGVAVGGFFGNLNWKWLGAIIIALVVIASTGEIINMITGCKDFTQAMIVDTLK